TTAAYRRENSSVLLLAYLHGFLDGPRRRARLRNGPRSSASMVPRPGGHDYTQAADGRDRDRGLWPGTGPVVISESLCQASWSSPRWRETCDAGEERHSRQEDR